MTGKLEDTNAYDINALIKYVMWSKDKIAGGVSQENAVKALARMIDYDIDLMKSISGKTNKEED
jgi:hypothetical protein